MTRDDVLRLLLACSDDTGRVLDHSEVSAWPPGAREEFQRAGLLWAAQTGLTATCPNCAEPHIEPVMVVGEAPVARYFIRCPESLRVEVTPEMCRGWEVNPHGLAPAVGAALDLKGSPKAVVPDRLWRLGRIPWQSKTREVLLALRMADADASSVAAHVGAGGRAIVLVPHHVPDERLWPGRAPAVVALSRVASLDGDRLVIDGFALMESVAESDALAEARSAVPVDPDVKRLTIRRQVKAEIKGHLGDDILVAAYKQHGSFRGAAKALTEQLGRPVSKDQVSRAVQRAGGIDEVADHEDSASVARRVASQSRDRAKKIERYR
jgi:hypothetical protein